MQLNILQPLRLEKKVLANQMLVLDAVFTIDFKPVKKLCGDRYNPLYIQSFQIMAEVFSQQFCNKAFLQAVHNVLFNCKTKAILWHQEKASK